MQATEIGNVIGEQIKNLFPTHEIAKFDTYRHINSRNSGQLSGVSVRSAPVDQCGQRFRDGHGNSIPLRAATSAYLLLINIRHPDAHPVKAE
jgi:hypothetical protein